MHTGRLSIRTNPANRRHHIWCNNGTWWVAYVLHFSCRKRRVRRSLGTSCVEEAIRRRDDLFARIERDGEEVAERPRKDSDTHDVREGRPPVSTGERTASPFSTSL